MGFKDKFKLAYKPKTLKIVISELITYDSRPMKAICDRFSYGGDYDCRTTILQYTKRNVEEVREIANKTRDMLIERVSTHQKDNPKLNQKVTALDIMILEGNTLLDRLPYWEYKQDE